ncbi:MAG: OPT/YSL family transporter [Armatimonadota bacterium]|nr:OPT/YSL family transporter [Armatimonadota bacterium]
MTPSDDAALKNQAMALLKQGSISECISCLQNLLAGNPQDDQAYTYLGVAYSQEKNWDEAVSAFQQALAIRPSSRSQYNLGVALEKAGRLDEASSSFATAVAMDSAYQAASNALDRVKQAIADLAEASDITDPAESMLLDSDSAENPDSILPEDKEQLQTPLGEVTETEREAKDLETQKQMTRAGLIYGVGIGIFWYLALFFFQQLFSILVFHINPLVAKFAGGYGFFILIVILGVIGAAIGAVVGYAVGYTGGGEHTGLRVGALAGLITEPLKSIIGGATSPADLLIAIVIGAVVGAFAGKMIGRMVDLGIGWD